jgi:hypothetical protein
VAGITSGLPVTRAQSLVATVTGCEKNTFACLTKKVALIFRSAELLLLTFACSEHTISVHGHAPPTPRPDGVPLPHTPQNRRWGHGRCL